MVGTYTYLERTVDGVVKAGPGVLGSVHLAAGAGAATLVVYDNAAAAAGNVVARLAAPANGGDEWAPPDGVAFGDGLYADLGGVPAGAQFAFA